MSDPGTRLFTGKWRVAQYASGLTVLGALAVAAIVLRRGWAWGPFLAAPVVAVVVLVVNGAIVRYATSLFDPSSEERRRAAIRRRASGRVLSPVLMSMAVGWGILAAAMKSYVVDVVMAALVVLAGVVLPLAMLPAVRRRAAARRSGSA